ncbi:hypothetical protein ACMD2_26779 [Ananas comosus]|uniref:Uncharacterized protein n=1 Tax=Ananas comosus TaxID=4615 RepID=A0A199V320_ANACO|nr:hypothetical protein ACMD2_26779 [Ananas comosus]
MMKRRRYPQRSDLLTIRAQPKLREYRVRIPTLQERLIGESARERRLLDFLKASPSMDWFKRLKFRSPLRIFRRTIDRREEISISVPSPVGIRRHFHIHFIRKINWASLFSFCKACLSHPMNTALLFGSLCVAASGTMLVLLYLGLLNKAFPTKSSRNHWIEINTQILNALFTLMSIYQHPTLFHHLFLACRWRSEDVVQLRKVYCKNGAYRPREWAHMIVVILLLHTTCLCQYALCGLYWGFNSSNRPEFAEDLFFVLGTAAPVFAGVYAVYGPLGREYSSDSDEESQGKASDSDSDHSRPSKKFKLFERRVVVSKPEWVGGLFDCGDDATVGYLSFFCTFCVFGWNMERLGFGNMYVHMFTFLLLCVAPFWIFNISALNIHNYVIGDIVGAAGIVLCIFGLLYGGFWRIQMRKKFKLPGNSFCCGSASLTDYMQWMFCWACSLAQEVRTGNFYDVEDDSFYRKLVDGEGEALNSSDSIKEEGNNAIETMNPPVQPLMQLQDGAVVDNEIGPPPSCANDVADNSSIENIKLSTSNNNSSSSSSMKLRDYIPIYVVPTVEKGLLHRTPDREKRLLDFLKARPSKDWFLNFGFMTKRHGSLKSATAAAVDGSSPPRFRVPFVRKVDWKALFDYCKSWAKKPLNIALLVWLFFVAIGVLLLFLLMTGSLNGAIRKSSERKRWTETTNQILNALFTIMCLYQHPLITHHLILILRWRSSDAAELRKTYCKNPACGPYERAHIFFVVSLFHLTCFAQYAYCALFWAYTSKNRPDWAVYLFMGLGLAAPIVAALYMIYGPLGKKRGHVAAVESPEPHNESGTNLQKIYSGRVVVTKPVWVGGYLIAGMIHCGLSLIFLHILCVWVDMERLGFGNIGVIGIVLCFLGGFVRRLLASTNEEEVQTPRESVLLRQCCGE